ncbi:MAG: type I-D CRISPR-associated protein Cas5/Csc1 [Candidatus Jordarchaeales archaeon]
MEVYLVELITQDFLFFTTRELKTGIVEKYINNTTLLYAVNFLSPVQRVVSGTIPHYEEDWCKFTIYTTPAKPQGPINIIKISYNSVSEELAFQMEEEKRALPKYGAYQMIPPNTRFFFYAIGGKGPGIVRVGKKSCICRLKYRRLEVKGIKKGVFKCDHPINPKHMPKDFVVKEGLGIPVPPVMIFDNVTAEGEYIVAEDDKRKHNIAIPDKSMFKQVHFDE